MIIQPRAKFYDRQGDDEQCRSLYSLNDLAENEDGSILDTLFYFWDSVRGGKAAPTVAEFNIETVFGAAFGQKVFTIDTQYENPENFLSLKHPNGSRGPVIGFEGSPIESHPSRIHRDALKSEYETSKSWITPFYHEINQIICGYPRHYMRILLPLADQDGNVVKLAYAIRWKPDLLPRSVPIPKTTDS